MRVRIVRRPAGVLEGVSLSAFIPGLMYDVRPSLGHYLVAQRFANEVADDAPVIIVSTDEPPTLYSPFQGGVHVERAMADDRPPRRSRKRR